jgi:hypothetical protein
MAIIDLVDQNIADTPEPVVLPADSEVKLMIISCEYNCKEDKNNGNPYLMIRFEVCDEPLAKEIGKFIGLPSNNLDAKKNENNKRTLKYLGEAFGVDFTRPFDADELVGLTGWVILGVEHTEQYGDQNFIKRFVTGA